MSDIQDLLDRAKELRDVADNECQWAMKALLTDLIPLLERAAAREQEPRVTAETCPPDCHCYVNHPAKPSRPLADVIDEDRAYQRRLAKAIIRAILLPDGARPLTLDGTASVAEWLLNSEVEQAERRG